MPRIDLIQLRRAWASEWTASNPVLSPGEPGVEMDTGKSKYGDGVRAWNDLPYTANDGAPGPPGEDGIEIGPTPPAETDILWADTTASGAGDMPGPPGPPGPPGGNMAAATIPETIAGVATDKAVTPQGLAATLPYFNVRRYGAVGNGTTDDTAAIQAALTAAGAVKGVTLFPPGSYLTSGALTTTASVEMLPGARITYTGTGVALTAQNNPDLRLNVDIYRSSVLWNTTDTTSIGLRVRNADWARVSASVRNFAVGVDMHGDADGCSYGVIDCRDVVDNKIGFRCSVANAGWANSHEVHGRIRINSSYAGVAGTRLVDLTTGGNAVTLMSMSFEGNSPEMTVDVSVSYVVILNCRFEQSTGIRVNTGGSVQILGGYGILGYDASGATPIINNGGNVTIISQGGGVFRVNSAVGSPLGYLFESSNSPANVAQTYRATNTGTPLTFAEQFIDGTYKVYRAAGKGGAQPAPSVIVDGIGRKVWFGDGTADPTAYLQGTSLARTDYGPTTAIFRTLGAIEIDGALDHDGTTVGFYNVTPVVRATVPAAATDATTTQALVNALRTALVNLGLVQ